MKRNSRLLALFLVMLLLLPGSVPSFMAEGSLFTTDIGGSTNQNVSYVYKTDVYIYAQGLTPNSSYYVEVSVPSGTVLGKSLSANFQTDGSGDSAGPTLLPNGAHAYRLWDLVKKADLFTEQGFNTTTNKGGEYSVNISTDPINFSNAKNDNFKAKFEADTPPILYPYTIEHYKQDAYGSTDYSIVAADTETGSAVAGTIFSAETEQNAYTGFVYHHADPVSGIMTVSAEGTNVLKLYYNVTTEPIYSYTIEHYKQDAYGSANYSIVTVDTETGSAVAGTTFSAATEQNAYTGFVYYHADPESGIMNVTAEGNNVLKLYYNVTTEPTFSYTIEHYKQDAYGSSNYSIVAADTETGSAIAGTTFSAATEQNAYTGFVYHHADPESGIMTVTAEGNNVLKLYYNVTTEPTYSYTIEHYKQDAYGSSNYSIVAADTETGSAVDGTIFSATNKQNTYSEYVYDHATPVSGNMTVSNEGSNLLKLFYNLIFIPDEDIQIIKTTSSSSIRAGNTVTWTYIVTNTGNVDLFDIEVTDDNGTPLNNSDDFTVTDVNKGEDTDTILEPGESWTYTATGTAIRGLYKNIAYVTAWTPGEKEVSAQDDSSYTGYVPSNPRPDPDPGRIEIFKFLDVDNSGSFNTGDLPFSNILFQLFNEVDDLVGTATTNSQGYAVFSNLEAGDYFIKEVRGDYTITTPELNADGMIAVEVGEDETTEISIGNYREVIPPQEPPLGPPPVIEEVEEEAPPLAIPVLPKTGELPPYFAYGFGSLLVLAGLFMKRKF